MVKAKNILITSLILMFLLVPNIATAANEYYDFSTGTEGFYKANANAGYFTADNRTYSTLTMYDLGGGYVWYCKPLTYNYNETVIINTKFLGSASGGSVGFVLLQNDNQITNFWINMGLRWGLKNQTTLVTTGNWTTTGAFFSEEAGHVNPVSMTNYTIKMELDLQNYNINYINRSVGGIDRNIFNITPVNDSSGLLNKICLFGVTGSGSGYIDLAYINVSGAITGNYLNFSYYYLNNLSLVKQNVNLTVSSLTGTSLYNSVTGVNTITLEERLTNPTYNSSKLTLRANTHNYDGVYYVVNNELENYSLYFDSGTEAKTFNVINNIGEDVASATLSFYTIINGTEILFTQGITDFSGTLETYLNPERDYIIRASHGQYNDWEGNVTPTEDSYTINIQQTGEDITESLFENTRYSINTKNNMLTFESNLTVFTTDNTVEYFGSYAYYNGTYYHVNISSINGGLANMTITPLKTSLYNMLNITYYIKVEGYELAEWNNIYFLTNITGSNQSLLYGLLTLDDELPDGYKVVMAVVIMLTFMFLVVVMTGSTTATLLTGVIMLGVVTFKGLIPPEYSIISGVLIVLLLVVDYKSGV